MSWMDVWVVASKDKIVHKIKNKINQLSAISQLPLKEGHHFWGLGSRRHGWRRFRSSTGWLLDMLDTPRSSFLNIVETKIFVAERQILSQAGCRVRNPTALPLLHSGFMFWLISHTKLTKKLETRVCYFQRFLSEGTKDNNFRQGPLLIAGRQSVC